jgi:hypothetical protein
MYGTSADPRSLSDDGDPAEEQLLMRLEEELCPEGSVLLHRLCARCQRMFDTFTDVYTWLKEAQSHHFKPRKVGSYTLADFSKYRKSCHFCEMVCSRLGNDNSLPEHVSVEFRLSRSGGPNLETHMWTKIGYRGPIRFHFGSFTREMSSVISE